MTQGNKQQPGQAGGGDKPADPNHEIIAAVNALGEKYEAAHKDDPEHNRETVKWARRAGIGVGIYTLLTFALTIFAYCQLRASREAVIVAEQTLVDVERPIMLAEITNDFPIGWGSPQITLNISNFGKQLGLVTIATSSFNLQKETLPPADVNTSGGNGCVFYIVGEWVIRPDKSKSVSCIRKTPLTPQEASGLIDGSLYAFYVVTIGYQDLIGSSRIMNQVFLLRPNGNTGKFVQVGMQEENNRNQTPEQKAETERILVDTILQIERSRPSKFPAP